MANTKTTCPACERYQATIAGLKTKLAEVVKLCELQKADLERLKATREPPPVNRPERAPDQALQLALDNILLNTNAEPATTAGPHEDPARESTQDASQPDVDEEAFNVIDMAEIAAQRKAAAEAKAKAKRNAARPHGRRRLGGGTRPVEHIILEPDEVLKDPERYELIEEVMGRRLAYRRATVFDLVIVRRKYVLRSKFRDVTPEPPPFVLAPLPASVWPAYMADPSAIAQHAIAKYGDCLPLHRQEKISLRDGFVIPRSTQCDWLKAGYSMVRRITDAMLEEAKKKAFCIATDATSAPVKASGKNVNWHMFVLLADQDHVVFRPTREHTSETVKELLAGYRGYVLADAATVFDQVYRDGSVIEVGCWFHLRRHFWRGIASESERAYEVLALISGLFAVERACRDMPAAEKTKERARRARPWLKLLDEWVRTNAEKVDPRGPIHAGIVYYRNQRAALRRFLEDGRLRVDNNLSEQELRHLVLGRANWTFFANEAGLHWYACFRSLIASCALHQLNPHSYLEEVLRLAPHWPVNNVLELAPKYWAATRAGLSAEQQEILVPPWLVSRTVLPKQERKTG